MATATIPTGAVLLIGTTGSDEFTLTDALAGAINGNGGDDALILGNTADTFAALGAAATYTLATDAWSVGGQALTGGFDSVTFADGITIEAGVAASGTLDPTAGAPTGTPGQVALLTINDYNWTGTAGSTTTFTTANIVTVDGVDVATAGANFGDSGNQGLFTVAGTNLAFTADTAAIAAQGNVDDTATFTFEVVVEDATGATRTVDVTYSALIAYTAGADTFEGTAVGDNENGLAGDDMIAGAGGNDTIQSGLGDDSIFGEDGNDTITNAGGNDIIRGGNGNDTIDGSLALATEMQSLGGGNGDDSIIGGNGADTIFGSGGNDDIAGTAGDNILNGGGGNDTITAGSGDDIIRAGDGDDSINGGAGDSELRGGAGTDTITGGAGNEIIYTSLGGDSITGGAGDDSFIIKTGTGDTVITDFGTGNDELTFEGTTFSSLAELLESSYEVATGVIIIIDEDTTLTLTSANLTDLTAANTDFA